MCVCVRMWMCICMLQGVCEVGDCAWSLGNVCGDQFPWEHLVPEDLIPQGLVLYTAKHI